MGSLFDPCYQTGKCGEPEYGVDHVNDSVDVCIRKAAYSLENRGSRLVDERRYAAPALQKHRSLILVIWVLGSYVLERSSTKFFHQSCLPL